MSDDIIIISDRIKELSNTTGTGNFNLDGAAVGFSTFGSFYNYNDALFYAITDGTDYEVGSGQYILDSTDKLVRFPFNSSNSNNAVSFGAGLKEVYVTYPGKYSVFTGSGLGSFQPPQASGLAFWGGQQILDYNSNIVFNATTNALGISENDPQYAIHIGGVPTYSAIKSSGLIVGDSGVMFSGINMSYSGGRQLEPFFRNELDGTTGTDDVFALSGLVDQRILFRPQNAGLVLAGPPSGCAPPTCSPNYPTFRALTMDDMPNFSEIYAGFYGGATSGTVAFYRQSGVLEHDSLFVWDKTTNYLGINTASPTAALDVNGNIRVTGTILTTSDVTVGGTNLTVNNIIFDDASVISGAYQAGSGLTLHNGLEFNIGEMFQVLDNDADSISVHQADNIIVSGVSGITTNLQASGTSTNLFIDGSDLNNLIVQVSGHINSVSGWASAIGSSWVISDGIGGSGEIGGLIPFAVSGVSGITTQYDSVSQIMRIGADLVDPSGHTFKKNNIVTVPLSGIVLIGEQTQNGVALSSGDRVLLVNQTDAKENGIWRVGADPYGSWTRPVDFPSSGEASARWTHQQMGTHYDESVWFCVNDNPCTIDYDNQEWRFFDGGAAVSGWVEATYSTSGILSSGTHFDRITFENEIVQIGGPNTGLGRSGSSLTSIMIGEYAGYYGNGNESSVFVGFAAGESSSGTSYATAIGPNAGQRVYNGAGSSFLGSSAGSSATGCSFSNLLGYNAGFRTTDCRYINAIGIHAAYNASGLDNTTVIGPYAATYAREDEYSVFIGNSAGEHISSGYFAIAVGFKALGGYTTGSPQAIASSVVMLKASP